MEWISRGGHLFKFAESGGVSTGNTRLTVSPLVPETTYRFRVSAVTAKGPGREVVVMATTGHPFREHTSKYIIIIEMDINFIDFVIVRYRI